MHTPTITMQTVNQDHITVIADFVHRLIDELSHGEGPNLHSVMESAEAVLQNEKVTGIMACRGSEPIGLIMLNECAAIYAGGTFGEVSELYVVPDFRSKGVAAMLIKKAVAYGREHGWKRLEVGAPDQPTWKRTLDFYLRSGFDEVGPRLRKLI